MVRILITSYNYNHHGIYEAIHNYRGSQIVEINKLESQIVIDHDLFKSLFGILNN
jgi:hypothetical protein